MEGVVRPKSVMRRKSLARLTLSRGSSSPPAGGPEDLSPQAADEMNQNHTQQQQHQHHHPSGLTVPVPLPGTSGMSTVESTKAMVRKRITTWEYLRKANEGRVYWFNTVLLSKEDLVAAFEHNIMKSRTVRFAVLGMSLSSLLDIPAANDFLRGLLSLVQEFDAVVEDKFDRKNQRGIFRVNSRPKRGNSSGADFSTSDTSFLFTPNIPFELDYFQVLYTTCSMIIDTYQKILDNLGPSSSGYGTGNGTSGMSSRATTPGGFPVPPHGFTGTSTSLSGSSTGSSAGISPALVDVVGKIDAKLKKIITLLAKDVDAVARAAIKSELSFLSDGADWGGDVVVGTGHAGDESF